MISDFMIDHFNGIMNTIIFVLIGLIIYMFSITDLERGFYEFKQMVQFFMDFPELLNDISKAKL